MGSATSTTWHVATGTWTEYLKSDVEPRARLRTVPQTWHRTAILLLFYCNLCWQEREDHHWRLSPMGMRVSPYTRSKVENERLLLELHRSRGCL